MSKPHLRSPTIEEIRQRLAGPLPGKAGQIIMAPEPPAGTIFDRWDETDDCREAAVLLLLYPHLTDDDRPDLHLALMRRPEYPGVHSGQISFPGGRREGRESLQGTALRETWEEIGVSPESVEVIGRLSPLYIPPSNFCLYPFVAYRSVRSTFRLDPQEVAELIEAPLTLLLDPSVRREETWHFQKYGDRRIPFFNVYGHKVWGATAMILSEFLALLPTSRGADKTGFSRQQLPQKANDA